MVIWHKSKIMEHFVGNEITDNGLRNKRFKYRYMQEAMVLTDNKAQCLIGRLCSF